MNDQELIDNVLHRESPAGARPRPLTSSWTMHDRQPPPPRKGFKRVYIDRLEDGLTICEATDVPAAKALLRSLRGQGIRAMIREEEFDEKRLQEEDRDRRGQWSPGPHRPLTFTETGPTCKPWAKN